LKAISIKSTMKKIILSALLGVSVLFLASCSKQYNENVVGNGSTSGTGSGGGSSTNWNWTGTAPVSLKCDTTSFQGDAGSTTVTTTPYLLTITSQAADHLSSVILAVPVAGLAGHEYSIPMNGSIVFQNLVYLGFISTSGNVKIITNNSTTIEGYFFASGTDQLGGNGSTVNITQGYFKVAKP
jgi:hypothetical protein